MSKNETLKNMVSEIVISYFNMTEMYGRNAKKSIIEIIGSDLFPFDTKCKILTKLFKNVSNINFDNSHTGDEKHNINPLIFSCHSCKIQNRYKLIKFLVEEIGLNINVISDEYIYPIMYAYDSNYFDIVIYLLSQGANIICNYLDGKVHKIIDRRNNSHCNIASKILLRKNHH